MTVDWSCKGKQLLPRISITWLIFNVSAAPILYNLPGHRYNESNELIFSNVLFPRKTPYFTLLFPVNWLLPITTSCPKTLEDPLNDASPNMESHIIWLFLFIVALP